MANSKIVYYGNTLIDLTGDTVTAGDVLAGKTFHTKAGTKTTGTLEPTGATWTITGVVGATVTVTGNSKTYTKTIPSSGKVEFKGLTAGTWTAKMSKTGETTVTMTRNISTNYSDTMSFKGVPEFTYTGTYEIVDDNDNPISSPTTWNGNWKIRFLTSGTLRFTNLRGYESIDAFLVGGGGSGFFGLSAPGGSGGYTKTISKLALKLNYDYKIVIGAGGAKSGYGNGLAGGATSFAEHCVNGGSGGGVSNAKGGSGGGGYQGKGGTDGSAGTKGAAGQGTTTREFGTATGRLYSGGGGGQDAAPGDETAGDGRITNTQSRNGMTNRGGGGAGQINSSVATTGGSGIVVIRNAR